MANAVVSLLPRYFCLSLLVTPAKSLSDLTLAAGVCFRLLMASVTQGYMCTEMMAGCKQKHLAVPKRNCSRNPSGEPP